VGAADRERHWAPWHAERGRLHGDGSRAWHDAGTTSSSGLAMRPGTSAPERVSTLELFFDLVFVFTITQVATIIVQSPHGEGIARAAIQLGVIYWMYDGYAWMTNAAAPDTWQHRLLLLIGMAGFFVCALAVPGAFGDDGIVFGAGYLAVTVVHLVGFVLRPGATPIASIYGLAPGNLISAGLLLAAGVAHRAAWVLWTSALVVQIATPVVTRRIQGFAFNPAHFAERHSGLLLIVFGESLLSVGLAARSRRVDLALVLGALACLAATAAMWWAYFVRDSARGAQAFAAAPPKQRVIQVLIGYELATAIMIFGVVAVAAATTLRVFDLLSPAPGFEAWLIAQGAMLFLLGSVGFRLALRFGSRLPRVLGAALCLVAVPVARHGSAAAGLLAIAAVIAATLASEHAYEHAAEIRTRRVRANGTGAAS
jgi:low temperature requirement protein LtrA